MRKYRAYFKRMIGLLAFAAIGVVVTASRPIQAQEVSNGSGVRQRGADHGIVRLEFKETRIVDAVRLVAESSGVNVVTTEAAGQKTVTLYLQQVTARQAIDTLCKVSGLWYREDKETQTFRVMTTEEYQKDLVIFREDITKAFTLLHPNAISVASAIADLFGGRVSLSLGVDGDDLTSGATSGFGGASPNGRPASTTSVVDRPIGGRSGGGATASSRESDRVVKEALTPDQLAELTRRLEERKEGAGSAVTSETLEGLSRQEPPIFVTVVRQHNVMVVRTSDVKAMQEIERLVVSLDRPTPQVLLEMKILELTLGDSFRSIFDLDFVRGPESSGPATSQPRNPLLSAGSTAAENVLGIGNFPLEGGTLIYQFLNDHIRARIQLLSRDNRINTLGTPMLLASNNRPARIFVGEERVLVTGVNTNVVTPAAGAGTLAIQPITEVRNIGNTLLILPKINADRTVTLSITQDSSTALIGSATIPVSTAGGGIQAFAIDTVSTANVQGTVVAKDKLTVAVGGLIRTSTNKDVQKVPFLGDIPVIGRLFRREVQAVEKTERVLLITPYILMTPAEGEETTRERMRDLSRHPYHTEGDAALEKYLPSASDPEDGAVSLKDDRVGEKGSEGASIPQGAEETR